ncbi:lipopolysaccharide biosynthesis protein [Mycolicibacterium sp. PDY-3]|uniref:lipopolysaccharide biosynthesis protein n=1 Tax=Mycolicibacterium sp. PDY-3 TaxID=3376069 RepID=UPI0037B4469A
MALQFAVVAVVTRALDAPNAGDYFVVMGVVLATYFAAGLGLPDGVVRAAPAITAQGMNSRAQSLLNQSMKYSLAAVPIGAGFAGTAIAFYVGDTYVGLATGAWWASYGSIFVCAQTLVASGRGELGTAVFYSAANVGQILVTVPLILVAELHSLVAVLMATAAGTALAAVACLVVTARLCIRHGAVSTPLAATWKQGCTIAFGRIVQAGLIWSPVFVASFVLTPSDTAHIGLAVRLVSAVAAVIAAIRFSIRPSLARDAALGRWADIARKSSKIAFATTSLALVAIAAAATVGPYAVSIIFGNSFREAATVTAIMLIGTLGESIGGPVDEVLRMAGQTTEVLVVQLLAFTVGIGAQFILGSQLGMFALVSCYSTTFVGLYVWFVIRLRLLHGIWIVPRP